MTKISNRDVYREDLKVSELDFVVGSDYDDSLRTVNFRVRELADFIGKYNGTSPLNFVFFFQPNDEQLVPPNGYFFSKLNIAQSTLLQEIYFSKRTFSAVDVTKVFDFIKDFNSDYRIKLSNPNDPNNFMFLNVVSATENTDYYTLVVSHENSPDNTLFEDQNTYILDIVPKGGGGSSITKTSELINDGEDGTSTYVETDELGDLAFKDEVDTDDIVNHAVTNVKLANMNSNTVKGRFSGNGTPQDISMYDLPISTDTQTGLDNKIDKVLGQDNFISKLNSVGNLSPSIIFDNGTTIGIGTTILNSLNRLQVNGRTFISAGVEGGGQAPLIVRNTIPYQSPFNQFLQVWENSAGGVITSLRADGSFSTSSSIGSTGFSATLFGSLSFPAFRFGATGNGMYSPSANAVGLVTNDVERIRILATGEIAIGATTAGARLDVRAQGALATDITLRVRNSTDTFNLFQINGIGRTTLIGNTSDGSANGVLVVRNNDAWTGFQWIQSWLNSSGTAVASLAANGAFSSAQQISGNTLNATNPGNDAFPSITIGGVNGFRGTSDLVFVVGNTERARFNTTTGAFLIGTTANIPSARLVIESTTQGFLPPRMTTAQRNAIATPAGGLVVYDTTDNKHYGYNGTTWNAFY